MSSTSNNNGRSALILGGNGRFGRAAKRALTAAGWTCKDFNRDSNDLVRSAQGCQVIINAWNPPYPQWQRQVPTLTQRVIEAGQATGARIVIPANVYVFGNVGSAWTEQTPFSPRNKLGQIRADMEQAYKSAGVKTLILRAGDFLDTSASGNWFDQVLVAKQAQKVLTYPGKSDISHSWAYLPDLCQALTQLLEQDLPHFESLHFPGYTLSGQQMARHLHLELGHMNWLPLRLLSPISPMMRSLLSMRYLWEHPHQLESTKFDQYLPGFKPTSAAQALSLAALGARAGQND